MATKIIRAAMNTRLVPKRSPSQPAAGITAAKLNR